MYLKIWEVTLDWQSSYSFGKIQNVEGPERSEEKLSI